MSKHTSKQTGLIRSSSGQLGQTGGYWKKFVIKDAWEKPNQIAISRYSQRVGSPYASTSNMMHNPHFEEIEEKNRKRQQMMKRVKSIQEKVKPLIDPNEKNIEIDEFSNNSKLQQRIAKLETALDAIQKQMDIKIEKRILDMQRIFLQRIDELNK